MTSNSRPLTADLPSLNYGERTRAASDTLRALSRISPRCIRASRDFFDALRIAENLLRAFWDASDFDCEDWPPEYPAAVLRVVADLEEDFDMSVNDAVIIADLVGVVDAHDLARNAYDMERRQADA